MRNLTIEHCKFTATAGHTDSRFWWGGGNYFGGDVVLRNCRVEGFTSPHLADFSTGSNTPVTALRNVTMTECYFKQNAGSVVARGLQSNPIKTVTYTKNLFETTAIHALLGLHGEQQFTSYYLHG